MRLRAGSRCIRVARFIITLFCLNCFVALPCTINEGGSKVQTFDYERYTRFIICTCSSTKISSLELTWKSQNEIQIFAFCLCRLHIENTTVESLLLSELFPISNFPFAYTLREFELDQGLVVYKDTCQYTSKFMNE